ncbi:MAG: cupin domain-containing protein, partial [Mycobacterium sp.]
MVTSDGFHPDFEAEDPNGHVLQGHRLHHIKASDIDSDTAQTEGMRRFAALSGRSVGAEKLWMGETHVAPGTVSANHHHGESETAIYVRSGNPEFVFHDGVNEVRFATQPGDYVFVPPYL